MKLVERTADQPPPSPPTIERPLHKGEHWSQDARKAAVAYALERMTDADSLESACRSMDINPGTVWGWIMASPEALKVYENTKIQRSRALMERALDEMQSNPMIQVAESRARIYMRLAALLNPAEFSDKVHAALGKQPPSKPVSFLLFMNGQAQAVDMGVIEAIGQPEVDGE